MCNREDQLDDSVPESPVHFITLMWDQARDEVTVNIGDWAVYEAIGILDHALRVLKQEDAPALRVVYAGDVDVV